MQPNRLSGSQKPARWSLLLLAILCLLIPTTALAGGGGHIRLSRPLDQVAAGKVQIYLQALQHDVYPRTDARVTMTAKSPSGKVLTAQAALDPQYEADGLYTASLTLNETGVWELTIQAEDEIFFPPLTQKVTVVAAGTKLPDPGPIQLVLREGETTTIQPAPARQTAGSEREGSKPSGQVAIALAASAAVAIAGLAAFWLTRRRVRTG
jgi:hypothetical protein